MKPIEFDWKEGTTSIVWEAPDIGIIRFHYEGDTDELPQFRGVCVIHVKPRFKWLNWIVKKLQKLNLGNAYEFKAMVMKPPTQTKKEHKQVKDYLTSLGLRGFSRRLRKDGEVITKWY